jgi:hypothetical protein
MGNHKREGKGSRFQHEPTPKHCETSSPVYAAPDVHAQDTLAALIADHEHFLRPVEYGHDVDNVNLDDLPLLIPAHGGLALDDQLAIEVGHDLDKMDLNDLPGMPTSCLRRA